MGQPARHISGLTLASVLGRLPIFERNDFGENEYLDVILSLVLRCSSGQAHPGGVDETERRTWFLFESSRRPDSTRH